MTKPIQKKSKLPVILSGIAAGVALAIGVNAWALNIGPDKTRALPLQEIRQFTDVYGAIRSHYVDGVGDEKLIDQALAGMVSGLDPHSAYLDAEAYKDLQEGTEGEFGGLGIEVSKDGKNGVLVVSPIDDTPAAKAGIRAGDIIIKIDDKFTYDLPLSKCVKLMRGDPETKITLQVVRKGEKKPLTFPLTRAIIKVQSIKFKELSDGFGYIRITQFQDRTQSDLAAAINSLHQSGHLKGLVLDLRNNPGGLLDAAVGVCSEFLPKGLVVVSTKGRTVDSNKSFSTGMRLRNIARAESVPEETKTVPLVVLINPASASASEIVSGALQDHKRATIMGRRSFGKGSVQTVYPLSAKEEGKPTGVKLTTARYYTPSGRSIQAKGIVPDIEVLDTAKGNYPSYIIREADLNNHLTVSDEKDEEKDEEAEAAEFETDSKKVYKFGDEDDFTLQQAVRFLKGEKVMTAADAVKQHKAEEKEKEKKAEAEGEAADSDKEAKAPAESGVKPEEGAQKEASPEGSQPDQESKAPSEGSPKAEEK